jgi:nitrate reductase delta subunit
MKDHRHLFSALGMLLDYPDEAMVEALPEIRALLQDYRGLPARTRAALLDCAGQLAGRPLLELQERYVEVFDRGRATSLYLFEHVHGESRERGQAMIDLLAMYEAKGLFLGAGELPDYLPVFLEFLAQSTPEEALGLLGEVAHINRQIAGKLAERGTPYWAVVGALLPLAGEAPLDGAAADAGQDAMNEDGGFDEVEAAALDKEWQDKPVDFLDAKGPGAQPEPVRFYEKRPPR